MQIVDKQKIYLKIGFLSGAVLLLFFAVYPFALAKIKSASQSLLNKRQAVAVLQKEQRDYVATSREYEKIRQQIEEIDQIFLAADKILDFIIALEQAAVKTNNQYEIKVVEQAKDDVSGLTTANFQVALKGSFPDFLRFLARLEALPYFSEITVVQIQRAGLVSGQRELAAGDVLVNLNITVYINQVNSKER